MQDSRDAPSSFTDSSNVSLRAAGKKKIFSNRKQRRVGTNVPTLSFLDIEQVIDVNALRALIIDNSISFRDDLADGLRQNLPAGSLVEKTADPVDALSKVTLFHPDVIVLNYAMSPIQINGQSFLALLTEQKNIPIIAYGFMDKTHFARLGIADYIRKPKDSEVAAPFCRNLVARMEHLMTRAEKSEPRGTDDLPASRATRLSPGSVMTRASWQRQRMASVQAAPQAPPAFSPSSGDKKIELIAIGSSTGGTEALATILRDLRPPLPGIVVTQHIPALFAKLFAQRLDAECALHVKEGADGDRVENNTVYIAPGNLHMTVHREGDAIMITCAMGPKVHSCRPSVDVLFDSVAANIGASAAGVILTGMGHDGAKGLLAMRRAGSPTLGQDEATCVVYGMPRAAWEMGAVEQQLPLTSIASAITQIARR